MKLKDGEAARIADYLSRVVPKGPNEEAELESFIKRLRGSDR